MLSTDYLQTSKQIQNKITQLLEDKFKVHPFSRELLKENLEVVMGNYLAMSQAFPYLQAGSQKEQIFHCIDANDDISEQMEITAVVGNFLVWDETGGHYTLQREGIAGLPKILETKKSFHSNLLRQDFRVILEKDTKPSYSQVTKKYLYLLYEGFSSLDPVVRCASMVAFETHAGQMITALWESLSRLSEVNKDNLSYFRTHVGGDDPAEPYHVKMTSGMIEKIVSEAQIPAFLNTFEKAYALSYFWCREITQLA